MVTPFLEIQFPCGVSEGSSSINQRRTDVAITGGGFEERNTRWANSRRKYDAGYGVKSLDQLEEVNVLFEEVRGKLIGFRWKDYADFKSGRPSKAITALDQHVAFGDSVQQHFRILKKYGVTNPWTRYIQKPVKSKTLVAVNGTVVPVVHDLYTVANFLAVPSGSCLVDYTTGIISFVDAPASGAVITCGYEFDVPVRFDTDELNLSISGVAQGKISNLNIVELRVPLAPLPPSIVNSALMTEALDYLMTEDADYIVWS